MNAREDDAMTPAAARSGAARGSGRSRRLWSAATAVVLVAGVPVLGCAVPAAAADNVVQLSLDGAHWSTTLAGPLFANAQVVPGDVVDATLWVRNASTATARLSIRAAQGLGTGTDDLAGNLTLQVDGAPVAGGATWDGPMLAPGEQTAIPLVVTFDADVTSGMLGVANVLDTVVLTGDGADPTGTVPDASGGAPASGGAATTDAAAATGPGASAGSLALTGGEVRNVALTALAAIVVGLLLVWRRRREDEDDEPVVGEA